MLWVEIYQKKPIKAFTNREKGQLPKPLQACPGPLMQLEATCMQDPPIDPLSKSQIKIDTVPYL